MGVVFAARDEKLGRDVAVKLLPAAALGDEQARRRLMREAQAAAGLEHPGIVHVYDVGETGQGDAFLVMELVKGKTLRAHLDERGLGLRTRMGALIEVGRALAFAHERGFFHRDIKPDNVMIRDDGRAVVLDFVDASALQDSALPSLALERAAVRAAKRGDCQTARRLAERLVDGRQLADEKPPSVDRMKRLASRCAR